MIETKRMKKKLSRSHTASTCSIWMKERHERSAKERSGLDKTNSKQIPWPISYRSHFSEIQVSKSNKELNAFGIASCWSWMSELRNKNWNQSTSVTSIESDDRTIQIRWGNTREIMWKLKKKDKPSIPNSLSLSSFLSFSPSHIQRRTKKSK